MAYADSQNERFYIQTESTPGTIPNSGGTATLAAGDCCKMIKASMEAVQAQIERPDKTGSRSAVVGIVGRKSARWSAEQSLASAVAGTEPDCDPILRALFGKAGVVGSGPAKVTYGLEDASPTFSLWSFRTPSAVAQRVAAGCMVRAATFNLGQDNAIWSAEGEAKWVLDTDQFATADSGAKSGLTAFPSEPASPVVSGIPVVGFTGSVTLDGNTYTSIRSATIRMDMAREYLKDVFNSYYVGDITQGRRNVTVDFSIYDDDTANLKSLKVHGFDGGGVTLTFQLGTVTGNIWTFTLSNVLLSKPQYDDSGSRFSLNFNGCRAHASSDTAKDEVGLVIT